MKYVIIVFLLLTNVASAKTIRADVIFEDGTTCTYCKLQYNPKGQVGDYFDITSIKDKNENELFHGQKLKFQKRPSRFMRFIRRAADRQRARRGYAPRQSECQTYSWGDSEKTTCTSSF